MTTRLAGTATHFLPFNKGCDGGAGNPPDPAGRTYRTAYLWEEVLQRDSLLDLLARFIHLQIEEKRDDQGRKVKTETMIFPRYHQLQAVRMLVDAARSEGRGAQLPRRALGRQRQEQHDRLAGAPAGVAARRGEPARLRQRDRGDRPRGARPAASGHDLPVRAQARRRAEDRRELAAARRGARERACRSSSPRCRSSRSSRASCSRWPRSAATSGTGTLPTRRCAVIIDEAHSSQGGETATDLKEVLGGEELREEAQKRAAEEGRDDMEELFRSMAKRGRQANLSFFAFTATPKHKTLAVFGRDGRAGAPLHDAAGDRGGVHPRRAEALHDLRDLLQAAQGLRGRSRTSSARRRRRRWRAS